MRQNLERQSPFLKLFNFVSNVLVRSLMSAPAGHDTNLYGLPYSKWQLSYTGLLGAMPLLSADLVLSNTILFKILYRSCVDAARFLLNTGLYRIWHALFEAIWQSARMSLQWFTRWFTHGWSAAVSMSQMVVMERDSLPNARRSIRQQFLTSWYDCFLPIHGKSNWFAPLSAKFQDNIL